MEYGERKVLGSSAEIVRKWIFEYSCRHNLPRVITAFTQLSVDGSDQRYSREIGLADMIQTLHPVFRGLATLLWVTEDEDVDRYPELIIIASTLYDHAENVVEFSDYILLINLLKLLVLIDYLERNDNKLMLRLNNYFPKAPFSDERASISERKELTNEIECIHAKFLMWMSETGRSLRVDYLRSQPKTKYTEQLHQAVKTFINAIDSSAPACIIDQIIEAEEDSEMWRVLRSYHSPSFDALLHFISRRNHGFTSNDVDELINIIPLRDCPALENRDTMPSLSQMDSVQQSIPNSGTIISSNSSDRRESGSMHAAAAAYVCGSRYEADILDVSDDDEIVDFDRNGCLQNHIEPVSDHVQIVQRSSYCDTCSLEENDNNRDDDVSDNFDYLTKRRKKAIDSNDSVCTLTDLAANRDIKADTKREEGSSERSQTGSTQQHVKGLEPSAVSSSMGLVMRCTKSRTTTSCSDESSDEDSLEVALRGGSVRSQPVYTADILEASTELEDFLIAEDSDNIKCIEKQFANTGQEFCANLFIAGNADIQSNVHTEVVNVPSETNERLLVERVTVLKVAKQRQSSRTKIGPKCYRTVMTPVIETLDSDSECVHNDFNNKEPDAEVMEAVMLEDPVAMKTKIFDNSSSNDDSFHTCRQQNSVDVLNSPQISQENVPSSGDDEILPDTPGLDQTVRSFRSSVSSCTDVRVKPFPTINLTRRRGIHDHIAAVDEQSIVCDSDMSSVCSEIRLEPPLNSFDVLCKETRPPTPPSFERFMRPPGVTRSCIIKLIKSAYCYACCTSSENDVKGEAHTPVASLAYAR